MLRGSCAWHLRRPRRCRIRGTPCRWSARDGRGSRGRPHRNNRFRKTACRLLVALCRGADASGYVASVPRMGHVRPRDAGRVPQPRAINKGTGCGSASGALAKGVSSIMKGVVTLQQSRHCAASSSTAAVAALPALRILCLFAVVLFPSAAHNYRGYLRLSCSA